MQFFFEQFIRILSYAGIVQGIFVVLLLNNRGVQRSRANVFLSVLLIALSFSIAHIFFAGAIIDHMSVEVYSLGDPTFFLIAPLLWFYTSELTGYRIKFSGTQLLHFTPFLAIILFSTTFRTFFPAHPVLSFLDNRHRHINIVFWTGMVLQFSGYLLAIRKKWIIYQEVIRQEVSNKENVDISWIRFFMIVFLLVNIFFLFGLFAAIHFEIGSWMVKSTALVFSLSIFALGYKGIFQKDVFQKNLSIIEEQQDTAVTDETASKSDQELIDRMLVYMEEKKPYLDPELSLSNLARDLNINRSQLSQLINSRIGDNFYDFVNKYRVEQVKKLISDPKMKNYNLLGIALEAGFKSKSTFNLIFKRFTGLTPTGYRKNLSQ